MWTELYRLMVMTRRRHRLFPQPLSWFKNLVAGMGDKVQVWLALKDQATVAAMLTLRHRSSVIYKYGCSDEKFHSLGVMPFLFWKLIEESKTSGGREIDFGRSDTDNEGLARFKDHFGASRQRLVYYKYSGCDQTVMRKPQRVGDFSPTIPHYAGRAPIHRGQTSVPAYGVGCSVNNSKDTNEEDCSGYRGRGIHRFEHGEISSGQRLERGGHLPST